MFFSKIELYISNYSIGLYTTPINKTFKELKISQKIINI